MTPMDDLIEVWKEFKKALGELPIKDLEPKLRLAGLILLAAIAWSLTAFKVQADEVGVIQRFGRYTRTVEPGLHFKFPPPVETLTKVQTERISDEEFGYRRGSQREYEDEALMLTGDLNSVDVQWVVQYKRADPVAFLFRTKAPLKIIRDLSEATMREAVGDRSVDEVLQNRGEVEANAKNRLQELLTLYETGLRVVTIQLKDVNPPGRVRPSFNEVNAARQEKEKVINQAQEQYNKVIPLAKGEADKVLGEARAYATQRVNIAQGEAERFIATWRRYQSSKDVTRRRMYLEAMEEILPGIQEKIIFDPNLKQVLPHLDVGGAKEAKP